MAFFPYMPQRFQLIIPFLSAILIVLHVAPAYVSANEQYAHILARAQLDPISLSIHSLDRRSPGDNTTFGAGLSWVTTSTDKQCVSLVALK